MRTHSLSYFAVQPRLAEDSCLQLSVITFYLFKRYLWMWAKSLCSDPLTSATDKMKWHGRTAREKGSQSPPRSHQRSQARHGSISRPTGACCSHLGESHTQMDALQFALRLSGKKPRGYSEAQEKCIICTTPSMFMQCKPSLAPRQSQK